MDEQKNGGRGQLLAGIILPSILIFALQFFVSYAGAFFLICLRAFGYDGGTYEDFFSSYLKTASSADFNVAVSLIYAAVGILLMGIWYKKSDALRGVIAKKDMVNPAALSGGAVLFALGIQLLSNYMIRLLSIAFPSWLAEYEMLTERMGFSEAATLPLVLYAVILAPICEELAYRGLTFRYGRSMMPFWPANIVQALLFAGMHMNPLQASYAFVLGLFLGYFAEKSGRLWVPVVLHMLFNVLGVFGGALFSAAGTPQMFFLLLFGAMVACYAGVRLLGRSFAEDAA